MVAAWLRWFNGSREPAQAQPTCDEGSVRWRTNALNSVTPEQDDSASRPGRIFHDEELHVPDEEAPASGATVAPESQEEQGESVASGRDIIFARHLHETCDPPPISWRTFLQQLVIHEYAPISLPLVFVIAGSLRKGLFRAQLQGFLPHGFRSFRRKPLRLAASAAASLLVYWALPCLFLSVSALAFMDRLYDGARDEAVVSYLLYSLHLLSVASKYAFLSDSERRRLFNARSVPVAQKLNQGVELITGWCRDPPHTSLLAELELAAAHNGVDLSQTWLVLRASDEEGDGGGPPAPGEAPGEGARGRDLRRALRYLDNALDPLTTSIYPRGPLPSQLGITGDGSAAAVGAALPSRKSGAASARRRVAGLSRRALAAAEQGRVVVSGGLLAASLVYRSYARTERTRRLVVLFTLLLSCVQAALPAVLRALCTKPPIGSSPLEKFAFFVILWYRLAEYFMLNMILYTVVQDFIHRAFVVRELGKLVRVTPRPLGRDAGAPAPAAAARSGRRSRRQFRAAKSNLQTSMEDVPLLEMADPATVEGWVDVRIVLKDMGRRYIGRAQLYFSIALAVGLATVIWQLVNDMQRKANLGEHLTGWGLYETGLIVFPLACYLLALLGFGAAVNGENTVQRNALLYHRLALRQQVQAERELAPPGAAASAGKDSAAEAEAGCGAEGWWGGSATGARRAGAPLSDADDALQICAELVLATEPLRAFGFPCSPELFKAAASFLVTAELLFAMYLSNSEAFKTSGGAASLVARGL